MTVIIIVLKCFWLDYPLRQYNHVMVSVLVVFLLLLLIKILSHPMLERSLFLFVVFLESSISLHY
jgi:hypothetical protein